MKFILMVFSVLTLSAQAHELKCAIFDLPSGENFIESPVMQITDAQLIQQLPLTVRLDHDLIQAEFQLSYSDEKHLLFEIFTHEVTNHEHAKFTLPLAKIPVGRRYKLGFVSTELTGMGNNTHSWCHMVYQPN